MKNNIKYLVLASLLIINLVSWGQEEEINHNVVVMRNYSPVIGDANKLSEQPQIIDTTTVNPNFKYSINSKPFFPQFTPKNIKPVKMIGEPLKKLYHNYALIGYGNYTKPMFEYRYGTKRSKDLLAGFNIKHLSQNGNIKLEGLEDKVYTGYSHNHANVFLHKIFKESTLETDLTYKRHGLHYYGHNLAVADTIMEKNDNRQVFSWMNATMRYKSTYLTQNKVNYNVAIDYNYYEDYYSNFLNDLALIGDFSLLYNKELIGLDFNIHHYNQLSPTFVYSNTMYNFHPNVKLENKYWGLQVGLNIDVDSNNDSTLYHFYPKIDFSYKVIDYFLVPYIGISGGKISNNYRKISLENPFIKPGLVVKNTNNFIVLNGGLRGNFTENLSYNLQATYSVIDNAYFYTNDSSNITENQFIVEYDDIERYDINAELNWAKAKHLQFSLMAKYHGFKLDKVEHAWHIPDYEVIFSTNYNLKKKIIIDFDMFVLGQRYAKTYYASGSFGTYETIKIPETFDMSIGIEYRYTKVLSAFLRVNNILARKNYLWNYYPTEGFNVMGGIIYSF